MLTEQVKRLVNAGAIEVLLTTDSANLHFMRAGNSILEIDKDTGTILREFSIR